jgi:hypothetical protein
MSICGCGGEGPIVGLDCDEGKCDSVNRYKEVELQFDASKSPQYICRQEETDRDCDHKFDHSWYPSETDPAYGEYEGTAKIHFVSSARKQLVILTPEYRIIAPKKATITVEARDNGDLQGFQLRYRKYQAGDDWEGFEIEEHNNKRAWLNLTLFAGEYYGVWRTGEGAEGSPDGDDNTLPALESLAPDDLVEYRLQPYSLDQTGFATWFKSFGMGDVIHAEWDDWERNQEVDVEFSVTRVDRDG